MSDNEIDWEALEAGGSRNGWGCLRPAGRGFEGGFSEPVEQEEGYLRIPFYGYLKWHVGASSWVRETIVEGPLLAEAPEPDLLTQAEAALLLGSDIVLQEWLLRETIRRAEDLILSGRRSARVGNTEEGLRLGLLGDELEDRARLIYRQVARQCV